MVERTLLTLTARDGGEHDALLHRDPAAERRRERMTGTRTAVVHVHGVMGNFLVGTLRFLAPRLAGAGMPVLVPETRMSNVGQIFGDALWEPALLDVAAACDELRARGYERVVLSGYSSGATLATLMAARTPPRGLAGLVSLGGPWGLPQAMQQRAHRFGAEPPYHLLVERTRAIASLGPQEQREADRVFVVERSRGPTRRPRDSEVYTARTWWNARGPSATSAMAFRQIGDVAVPILIVQGGADHVVHPDEADELARVARRAGNAAVTVVPVPGVDHDFVGGELAVVEAMTRWLGGLP